MIETERLLLRNYTIEDFDALYEIMGAESFQKNMEICQLRIKIKQTERETQLIT